jgi:predicted peptidase
MPAIPTFTFTTPATPTPTSTTPATPTPAPTATLAVQVGQQAYTFEAEVTQGSSTRNVRFNYLLFLPKDYGTDPHKKWPLILFLHGAGETGNDLEMLEKHGIPRIVEQQADFPLLPFLRNVHTEVAG